MSRLLVIAALSVSSLAVSAPAAFAQYRTSPQQSLGGSCENIQNLPSGYVTAECRDAQGQYRWSSIYYPYCRGDLTNQNGMLACTGATATGGTYVQRPSAPASGFEAVLGALAGAIFGGNSNEQPVYTPGERYPAWGETGYGDPRYDPRFGAQGWGYGAQGQWVPIAQRQAWLEQRIMAGERDGSLTRAEANRLRRELTDLERTEQNYTRGGLTSAERATLDRQFESLSARVRLERQDNQNPWANINQRQAELDARIDAGVRDRSLSQQEAARLRAEFQDLARLEAQYRQSGLTYEERADLDRRFDLLSSRIYNQRGNDRNGWANINQRQANLDARIDAGVRNRTLTTREAASLRSEFQSLARLEADYRRGGLTNAERADLDRRFDALSARIRDERYDGPSAYFSINERQAELDARIDAGVRDRSLTRREAADLRSQFRDLARLEAQYRSNGLTSAERDDLERRFNMLSSRIRNERAAG